MKIRIEVGGDNHREPFLNVPADLAPSVQVPTIRRQDARKRGLTLCVYLLFAASLAFPQEFSAPRNISNNANSMIPAVATDPTRGYVYVVCRGGPKVLGGTEGLWFMRSTDGGATFSTPMDLYLPWGFEPSVKVDSTGSVWITWSEQTIIGVMRSVDYGLTFSRVASPPLEDVSQAPFTARRNPDITVDSQGRVTLVWQSLVALENADIFVSRSYDGGQSFSYPINVSNDPDYSADPRVATGSGGSIHIVWGDPNSGPVRYVRSLDGSTFSSPQDIIAADKLSRRPRIAINGAGTITVVSEGTFFVGSTDNGNSFTQAQSIGGLGNQYPDVAMESNGTIDVVAQVYGFNRFPTPLTFASSPDGGATFRTLTFANTQGDVPMQGGGIQETGLPRITVGLGIHIVWYDFTGKSFDTFYTEGPTAELLNPNGGTNIYQFADNLFNYKVTYPALLGPPTSPVYLAVQPILISQAELTARLAGQFSGATLVPYDGTGGFGVLFRATCQDSSGNAVDCPETTGPYDVKTSWNSPSGQTISNPAFLMAEIAKVGEQKWTNIFTAYSPTRTDPTGSGRTCCSYSDFVFVDGVTGTPPTITINSPLGGGVYTLNQTVLAGYSCRGSLVTSCLGTVPSGSSIDTSSVGDKTFEVNAVVSGGPTADKKLTYSVRELGICLLYDPSLSVKSGWPLFVVLELCDAKRHDVSSSQIKLKAVSIVPAGTNAQGTTQPSGFANSCKNFLFIPWPRSKGWYIYALNTKGLATGSYLLQFTVSADPGSTYYAPFQIK